MDVHVSPPPERSEREALLVALARLERAHADDPYRAAWRRAGLYEASAADEADASYALSPRSTRGATRA